MRRGGDETMRRRAGSAQKEQARHTSRAPQLKSRGAPPHTSRAGPVPKQARPRRPVQQSPPTPRERQSSRPPRPPCRPRPPPPLAPPPPQPDSLAGTRLSSAPGSPMAAVNSAGPSLWRDGPALVAWRSIFRARGKCAQTCIFSGRRRITSPPRQIRESGPGTICRWTARAAVSASGTTRLSWCAWTPPRLCRTMPSTYGVGPTQLLARSCSCSRW